MAESNLAIGWKELQARVGSFLGFGPGALYNSTPWTTDVQFQIDGIVASGIRQFNNPPVLEGEAASYDWSFLKPTATIGVSSGAQTILLPDDFGGFEGEISILSAQSQMWWPIPLVNEGQVRQRYSELPQAVGRPLMASLQWIKGTGPVAGQRAQLFIFPAADIAYNLQFQYYVLPDTVSGAFPYPYGGASHAETILESCLAIAESRLDDSLTTHKMLWMERLKASVSADRRGKAQTLGYNGDNSDGRRWSRRWYGGGRITYNGQNL